MSKWQSSRERREFLDIFNAATRVLNGDTYRHDPVTRNYTQTYLGRLWFRRESSKYPLHPAVFNAMEFARPNDWQCLLLEWPHRGETDANRIAYTPSEKYGEQDRQLITSIGKYLTRHFPALHDHEIRDLVARHTMQGSIEITNDQNAMIDAVTNGPRSCMSHSFDIIGTDGETYHPYQVYHPSYGWGMAIRKEGGQILGRCLVFEKDETKCFVRSYKRNRDECSHSGVDEAIEAYLKSLGYTKNSSWPDDARVVKIETRDGKYLMPYIDGGTQNVRDHGGHFTITRYGELEAASTGGLISRHDATCSCCGDDCNEEDGIYVGRYRDEFIGPCCSDSYTSVIGRRGEEYYVHEDNAVYVDGTYYDEDFLSDNSIVEDVHGDYHHTDNVTYVESADAYYPSDDDDICYAEDSGRYELREDCWECEESGNWYTDAVDFVEIEGNKYHPDNAPDTDTPDMFDKESNNAAE